MLHPPSLRPRACEKFPAGALLPTASSFSRRPRTVPNCPSAKPATFGFRLALEVVQVFSMFLEQICLFLGLSDLGCSSVGTAHASCGVPASSCDDSRLIPSHHCQRLCLAAPCQPPSFCRAPRALFCLSNSCWRCDNSITNRMLLSSTRDKRRADSRSMNGFFLSISTARFLSSFNFRRFSISLVRFAFLTLEHRIVAQNTASLVHGLYLRGSFCLRHLLCLGSVGDFLGGR